MLQVPFIIISNCLWSLDWKEPWIVTVSHEASMVNWRIQALGATTIESNSSTHLPQAYTTSVWGEIARRTARTTLPLPGFQFFEYQDLLNCCMRSIVCWMYSPVMWLVLQMDNCRLRYLDLKVWCETLTRSIPWDIATFRLNHVDIWDPRGETIPTDIRLCILVLIWCSCVLGVPGWRRRISGKNKLFDP